MKTQVKAVAIALALTFGVAATAPVFAQGRGPQQQQQRGNDRNDRNDHDDGHRRNDRDNVHHYERGQRLPAQYRGRQYVVDNYRGHGLKAPPRGQQWVQSGSDYLLIAVATGVITQVLLGR